MKTAYPTLEFHNDAEIAGLVARLEACRLARGEFTHCMHLAVAAFYVSTGPASALARMRAALLAFCRHHGVEVYHETITRFWLHMVEAGLRELPPGLSLHERVGRLLPRLDDKELLFVHYSRERVMSAEARAQWVEPDLLPLAGT